VKNLWFRFKSTFAAEKKIGSVSSSAGDAIVRALLDAYKQTQTHTHTRTHTNTHTHLVMRSCEHCHTACAAPPRRTYRGRGGGGLHGEEKPHTNATVKPSAAVT